jgi:hypothetical protein
MLEAEFAPKDARRLDCAAPPPARMQKISARFEHAGVLAEVAKLPAHVGRSLATELRILSGQVCAPARHVILPTGVSEWAGFKQTEAVLSDAADVTEMRRQRYF